MYLLEKGRQWVEAKTVEVAGELVMAEVQGRWLGGSDPVYRVRVGSSEQNLVFRPAWLVYCSYEMSKPLQGLIMNEIRDKLGALQRKPS